MSNSMKKWQLLQDIVIATVGPLMIYYILRNYLSSRDAPQHNPELSRRLEHILADRDAQNEDSNPSDAPPSPSSNRHHPRPSSPRRHHRRPPLKLTSYEQQIAQEVIHPSEIPITFSDIGGLDPLIADLHESVIYPLTLPSLYARASSLLAAPSGVLLHGPPGCGKTMLAKALAHESGAVFINLHISTLTEKWYGDSNKLVAAVFSLARKLAPAIVFVDEVDAVLGTRRGGDHEASGMVKAEFMTHWDGLASAEEGSGGRRPQRVLVLGATNRPGMIDEAILRRMPKRFAVGLPDEGQRQRIFQILLRDANVAGGDAGLDMNVLVRRSAGMSGSDIKEACREATMVPVREFVRSRKVRGLSLKGMRPEELRGLRTDDFAAFLRQSQGASEKTVGQVVEIEGEEHPLLKDDSEEGDWKDVE